MYVLQHKMIDSFTFHTQMNDNDNLNDNYPNGS